MARRSTVQQDPRIAGDPESYPSADLDLVTATRRAAPRRGGWGGGGGRWLMWAGRALVWALIVVIVVNGVRAIFERVTAQPAGSGAVVQSADARFPVTEAGAFATQFAAVYLNFDATNPQQRADRLRPFIPEGASEQFGWNGYGRMSAGAFQFVGIDVTGNSAIVRVSYQSGGTRGILAVPVYREGDRFVVSERPALLAAPDRAGLPQVSEPDRDDATAEAMRPTVEGFFKAYGVGNASDLQLYVATGETISGLPGSLEFAQLKDLVVPLGGETSREVTAIVIWGLSSDQNTQNTTAPSPGVDDPAAQPAGLEQAYQLSMEKVGGKWFVKSIQGASRSVG
ncbi:conjugal transfer protein [Streptosporangiaceae bacterium NEAU-GS5]|nr:conjugal transfer protein [Streptosporangiaceae bacterium NEAU-GS5]